MIAPIFTDRINFQGRSSAQSIKSNIYLRDLLVLITLVEQVEFVVKLAHPSWLLNHESSSALMNIFITDATTGVIFIPITVTTIVVFGTVFPPSITLCLQCRSPLKVLDPCAHRCTLQYLSKVRFKHRPHLETYIHCSLPSSIVSSLGGTSGCVVHSSRSIRLLHHRFDKNAADT